LISRRKRENFFSASSFYENPQRTSGLQGQVGSVGGDLSVVRGLNVEVLVVSVSANGFGLGEGGDFYHKF